MAVHRRRGHGVAHKEVKREWNWIQSTNLDRLAALSALVGEMGSYLNSESVDSFASRSLGLSLSVCSSMSLDSRRLRSPVAAGKL